LGNARFGLSVASNRLGCGFQKLLKNLVRKEPSARSEANVCAIGDQQAIVD